MSKKQNPLILWGWYRKIRPSQSPMSSLGKPRDANRWSSRWIFLSHPHTHDRFSYFAMVCCLHYLHIFTEILVKHGQLQTVVFGHRSYFRGYFHMLNYSIHIDTRSNITTLIYMNSMSNKSKKLTTPIRCRPHPIDIWAIWLKIMYSYMVSMSHKKTISYTPISV